jgi:hypothetical protein
LDGFSILALACLARDCARQGVFDFGERSIGRTDSAIGVFYGGVFDRYLFLIGVAILRLYPHRDSPGRELLVQRFVDFPRSIVSRLDANPL